MKEASQAEISQDCRYTAVFDEQNRVLLIDNASGLIINVWKGQFFLDFLTEKKNCKYFFFTFVMNFKIF